VVVSAPKTIWVVMCDREIGMSCETDVVRTDIDGHRNVAGSLALHRVRVARLTRKIRPQHPPATIHSYRRFPWM